MNGQFVLLVESFETIGKPLWLVGGSVRDRLRGLIPHDLDYTTAALPQQVVATLTSLGLPVHHIGDKFGTIGTKIEGRSVEITTFRSESYTPGSRHPLVIYSNNLLEDLSRRDFTINAMALRTTGEESDLVDLVDPFDGQGDLAAGLIRAVGRPDDRFREDPLRMLRAVRFASTLDLTIEERTFQAIVDHPEWLATISKERVRDELSKLIVGRGVRRALEQLRLSGLLFYISPDLTKLSTCFDTTKVSSLNPSGDVWTHTTRVVEALPPTLTTRLAGLFHDIGKPATRSETIDRTTSPNSSSSSSSPNSMTTHFYGHEAVGETTAREDLSRLKFDQDTIKKVSALVGDHMRRIGYSSSWPDRSIRRFVHHVTRDSLGELFELFEADMRCGRTSTRELLELNEFKYRCDAISPRLVVKSPLDGNDLMRLFDLKPGPTIRRLKEYLESQVLDGVLLYDDIEDARDLARRWLEEGDGQT